MPSDIAEELIQAALQRIESRRKPICSTYRLQLHNGFTFRDATAIVPYLAKLGITHVYASPYFKAKPGSTHGYDVTDHCRLNPELGMQADYDAMVATLKSHGMHHLLDMVPNHVGIGNNDNTWWNDVLENGPASIYADYFDINWTGSPSADLNRRVLLPVLGDLYAKELEAGTLKVVFESGGFLIASNDRRFPVSPETYPMILELAANAELKSIIADCGRLPDEGRRDRHARKEQIKQSLVNLTIEHPSIQKALESINGIPGRAKSFDRLDALLRRQCFKLTHWRTAPDEINYRRFFDINDLAGLAMERQEVFEATHKLVLNLLAEDKVAGLRIDHPDGLRDPKQYLMRLQSYYIAAVAESIAVERGIEGLVLTSEVLNRIPPNTHKLYVSVEKILALGEPLIESWPVSGTTGYEFLNYVNGLFVDTASAEKFTSLYRDWIGDDTSCADLIYEKKKLILQISLASELNLLAIMLKQIAERDRYGLDFSLTALHHALREIIACFPVYRSYITASEISETDRAHIRRAVDAAIMRNPKTPRELFDYVKQTLIGDAAEDELAAKRNFAARFQQLTAPVTAKGIEDTTFYIYNRLLSLNEVGGDPSHFGVSPQALHAFFADRQRHWPAALSTLSTHDTKRSEDVRARLNVLSEIPDEWRTRLDRWRQMNDPLAKTDAPDRNEQYAVYQTLLGAWPFNEDDLPAFEKRVQACMLKSMREAKVHTRWTDPDSAHEEAVTAFIHALFIDPSAQQFRDDFQLFQKQIARVGVINSLAQTLLKLTAPGVPDTYQGTELWDLSLVDPDNRRPVDFQHRAQALDHLGSARELLGTFADGRAKMLVHTAALGLRRDKPLLFSRGDYIPLTTEGRHAANVFAFARLYGDDIAITVVPRLISHLTKSDWPVGAVWGDTGIVADDLWQHRQLQNVVTTQSVQSLRIAHLLSDFPVALIVLGATGSP